MEDELTPEGKELWNNLDNEDFINNLSEANVPKRKKVVNKDQAYQDKLSHIKKQVSNLADYSEAETKRWEAIGIQAKKEEKYGEYGEATVAKLVNRKLAKALRNILKGEKPFPDVIVLVDDE